MNADKISNIDFHERVLNKIGLAPTNQGLLNIANSGGYAAWIDKQLNNPNIYDDSFIKAKIKDFETERLNNFQLTLKYNSEPPPDQSSIMKEAFQRRAYYSLYSENRLREMMVWFWFNHFNVYGDSGAFVYLKSFEDIFRNNPFGNFRDILQQVIYNPAILTYSDNDLNTKPMLFQNETDIGICDNFARYILELYTLGEFGGYTQKDIFSLAEILSGLKSAEEYNFFFSDGSKIYFDELSSFKHKEEYESFFKKHPEFILTKIFDSYSIFFEEGHVQTDKKFLGNVIKSNNHQEIDESIEILALHPNTAKTICKKLLLFFIGTNHSVALHEKLVRTFISSNGYIKKVLEELLFSEEYNFYLFLNTTFKNPYEYYFSTTKMIVNGNLIKDLSFLEEALLNNSFGIHWKLTPEGYSLIGDDHISPNNLHHYINFSQMITNQDIIKNYFGMDKDKLRYFLISNNWLYK